MNDKVEYTPAQMACIEEHRDSMCSDNDWAEDVISEFIRELGAFGIDISTTRRTAHQFGGTTRSYDDPDVYWSVSYCQGDGASFQTYRFRIGDFMDTGALLVSQVEQPFGPLPRGEVRRDEDLDYLATCDSAVATCLREHLEWCEAQYSVYRLLGDAWQAVVGAGVRCTISSRSGYSHSGGMNVDELDDVEHEQLSDDELEPAVLAAYVAIRETADDWQTFLRQLADHLYDRLVAEFEYQTSDECVWEMIQSNDLFDPAEYADDDDDEVTLAQAA